ncbi:MAG: LacI family DNA-binding transcriptional regulator [Velocimicrobium sp.]
MVSMKDIALACDVSVATVSKALNNHKDVGEDTKVRIRETAKEMGYFPNSSARALRTNRSYNIGVLFVDEAQSGLTHDYFASVLDSFKVTVEKHGYDLTFINCNKDNKNRMSYLEHSRYRGLEGVIIACVPFDDLEVLDLVNSDLPVVTIDHLFDNRMAVISDNVKGISDLLRYIYKQGHRKIAYIHGQNTSVSRNRLVSFYKTVEELGLSIPDEYIVDGKYREVKHTQIMTNQILDLQDPPTCIIFPDDLSAVGGMNAINARGLKIPEDISIVGYDGISIASRIEPKLTTIRQDTKLMGRRAAEKLISLIEKPKSTLIEHIVIEGKLIEGKSVCKR